MTLAWHCPIFIQDYMSPIKHCIASQSLICLMFCLNIYTVFQCTSTSLQKSRAVVAWSLKLVCVNREVVKGHNEYWFACKFLVVQPSFFDWDDSQSRRLSVLVFLSHRRYSRDPAVLGPACATSHFSQQQLLWAHPPSHSEQQGQNTHLPKAFTNPALMIKRNLLVCRFDS